MEQESLCSGAATDPLPDPCSGGPHPTNDCENHLAARRVADKPGLLPVSGWVLSPGTILSLPQKTGNTTALHTICACIASPARHLTALQTHGHMRLGSFLPATRPEISLIPSLKFGNIFSAKPVFHLLIRICGRSPLTYNFSSLIPHLTLL